MLLFLLSISVAFAQSELLRLPPTQTALFNKTQNYVASKIFKGGDLSIQPTQIESIDVENYRDFQRILIQLKPPDEKLVPRLPYFQVGVDSVGGKTSVSFYGSVQLTVQAEKVHESFRKKLPGHPPLIPPLLEDSVWSLYFPLLQGESVEVIQDTKRFRLLIDVKKSKEPLS